MGEHVTGGHRAHAARAGVPTGLPLRRHAVLGRRTAAAIGAIAVAVLTGVLIVTTTADHHPVPANGIGAAADPSCTVTYRIGTDDGATFTGTLTLDAGDRAAANGWSVGFDMSNSQTFQAGVPATSTQQGAHVEVHLTGTGNVSAPFTGAYRGVNAMPAAFTADGRTCSPILIGPSGVAQVAQGATPSSTRDSRTGAEPAAAAGGPAGGDGNAGKGKGSGPQRPGKGKGADKG